LKKYVDDSAAVREAHGSRVGLRYGERVDEIIDVFTPSIAGNAPVVAFFHGGWWKLNNRVQRACLAAEYLKRGYGFASIGYPLAPEHSISTISQSARNAVSWLYRNATSFGLNPSKIVVAGNSAGGHLAALAASEEELAAAGVPSNAIVGIVALSGIYDLGRPARSNQQASRSSRTLMPQRSERLAVRSSPRRRPGTLTTASSASWAGLAPNPSNLQSRVSNRREA